jgi:hypothetical protein
MTHHGQWLVFRNDGSIAASSYAAEAAEATRLGQAVGQWDFFDSWQPGRSLQRRRVFVTQILRQVMQVGDGSNTHGYL